MLSQDPFRFFFGRFYYVRTVGLAKSYSLPLLQHSSRNTLPIFVLCGDINTKDRAFTFASVCLCCSLVLYGAVVGGLVKDLRLKVRPGARAGFQEPIRGAILTRRPSEKASEHQNTT